MAKYLHRLGAKHIKFDLDVVIHYLKLSSNTQTLIKIRVHRGTDKVEETQVMQYSPTLKKVQFDYPLNFQITMYKKSGKYSKKDLLIRVLEVQGKNEIALGTLTVEFHKLAEKEKSLDFEEFQLADCKDSKALLCLSVNLYEQGKKSEFASGNLKSQFATSNISPNMIENPRRAVSFDVPTSKLILDELGDGQTKDSQSLVEPEEDEPQRTRKGSVKTLRSAFAISEDLLNEINATDSLKPEENDTIKDEILEVEDNEREYFEYDTMNREASSDEVLDDEEYKIEKIEIKEEKKNQDKQESPKVGVKGLENGKEKREDFRSEQENYGFLKCEEEKEIDDTFEKEFLDSSSSEEVPEEIEVAAELPVPITDMKESEPNAASQELRLNLKEREAGLPESRKTTCCGNCVIY